MDEPRPKTASSPRDEAALAGQPEWADWPDEELLELRMCDLGLEFAGSFVQEHIEHLRGELKARGIRFRPHHWLSDEWFTPDGIPGIAVPFYLAHPRLADLERKHMLEVEGGTPEWCMRILRHEAGHAIDNAFALRRKKRRQRVFGYSSQPYPEVYTPRAYSKSYVLHLDSWYAQSHPDEDFAETFAVWLGPREVWERRYAGWPALKKLRCMDDLMAEVRGRRPVVTKRTQVDPLRRLTKTLKEHYRKKREQYGLDQPYFFDRDLHRLFTNSPQGAGKVRAATFLKRIRTDVRRHVAAWTGAYQYTINEVLGEIITRCQELDLHLRDTEERTRMDFTIFLTVQTMSYLHSGRNRVAL